MQRSPAVSCTAKSVSPADKSHAGTDRSIDLVLFDACKGRALTVSRPIQLRLPLARGNCMVKPIESEATNSWLQRARPECTSRAPAERDLAACPADERSVDCWDPWNVWLRYIDQPRRQRVGLRATSAG
jgi:hypothetical protein